MACTLTNIPGFALANAARLIEENRPRFVAALNRALGADLAQVFLASPALALCAGPEAFSLKARLRAYSAFPVSSCAYDFKQRRLFVDVTAVQRPYFLSRLLLQTGFTAYLIEKETLEACTDVTRLLTRATVSRHDLISRVLLRSRFDPLLTPIPQTLPGASALLETLEDRLEKGKLFATSHKKRPDAIDRAIELVEHNIRRFCNGEIPLISHFDIKRDVPRSLAAKTRLADYALPTMSELFGADLAKRLTEFPAVFPLAFTVRSDEGTTPWVATPDDEMPLTKAQKLKPLSALSLRPSARLQARLAQSFRENAFNAIANFHSDLASEEAERRSVIPYRRSKCSYSVRLRELEVSPDLSWGILSLRFDKKSHVIPALAVLWAMQASRLKIDCDYRARITFWAHSLKEVEAAHPTTYSNHHFPWTTMTFAFERVLDTGKLAGTSFVALLGKAEGRTSEVVLPQSLLDTLLLKTGTLLEVCGIHLIGELELVDNEKGILETALNKPNRFQGRRDVGKLATIGSAPALLARAFLTSPKTKRFRQRRYAMIEAAAKQHFAPATFLLGRTLWRRHKTIDALLRIAEAATLQFLPALRYIVGKHAAPEHLPQDIFEGITRVLATEYNDAASQYTLAQCEFNLAKRDFNNTTHTACGLAWLLQSVANGNNAAAYELSRAYAMGDNATLARAVLLMAVQRGHTPAQYWLAAYDRIGEALFTASEEEKEKIFKQRIEEGVPAAQLLLGLFYEFDCPEKPRAKLFAHALFSWVEQTLHDNDARTLRESIDKTLSAEQRAELPFLELWKELGLKEPPRSLPLNHLTAELAPGPIMMHPAFIRSIDSLEGDTPSERLMRQIGFVAENSAPVRLGLASEEGYQPCENLRVSGYGATGGITALDRAMLLVAASKSDISAPWDVASVYPIFEEANTMTVYLQGAIASFSHACGLLAISPQGPTRGSANALVAFDPLWPSLKNRYRTNERYSAAFYGLVQTLTVKGSFFEGLPPEVLQAIRRAVPDAETARHDKLVSFGAMDLSNALYRINAIVRHVDLEYTELFSVSFIKLEVDAFLSNEYAGNTFTLYLSKERLEGKAPPKVGQRIDALFELHAYLLATDNTSEMALN